MSEGYARDHEEIFFMIGIFLLGCGNVSEPTKTSESNFTPATGWVLVTNGGLADIKAAIVDYDALVREDIPGKFRVELHAQENGDVAVIFPDGLPSYDMANITVWLDAPPNQENVYGAKSWLTTPSGAATYFLKPEVGNVWGDTLVGASDDGESIRVEVPDTGISKISTTVTYEPEPQIELSAKPEVFLITLDTDTSFGNPGFFVNRP